MVVNKKHMTVVMHGPINVIKPVMVNINKKKGVKILSSGSSNWLKAIECGGPTIPEIR